MDQNLAQTAREALFREAWKTAYQSAQTWLKAEPDCAEAHFIAALAAGKLSGRTFTRREDFMKAALAGLSGTGENALKSDYTLRLIAYLDERFAPYLRVRPGFVFSSKEEALEYFNALQEQLEIVDALHAGIPENLTEARVQALRRIGRAYHAVRESYYFEEISVENNIPVRRKNRVRYGFMRSLKANAIYRKADEAFRALHVGSEEEERLLAEKNQADSAMLSGLQRLTEAQNGTDKLEILRAQTELAALKETAAAAEQALREYRAGQKNPHL